MVARDDTNQPREDEEDSPLEDLGLGVLFFVVGACTVTYGIYELVRGSFGVLLGLSFFIGPVFMLVGFGAFWRFVFGQDFSFGLDDDDEDEEEGAGEDPDEADDEDTSGPIQKLVSTHLLFLFLGGMILIILAPLMILLFFGGIARLFGFPLPARIFGPPGDGDTTDAS